VLPNLFGLRSIPQVLLNGERLGEPRNLDPLIDDRPLPTTIDEFSVPLSCAHGPVQYMTVAEVIPASPVTVCVPPNAKVTSSVDSPDTIP